MAGIGTSPKGDARNPSGYGDNLCINRRLMKMLKAGIKSRSAGDGSGAVELLGALGIVFPDALA